jgi:TonB family protein
MGVRLMQVAVLALLVALAMPSRAADERAIKLRVAPVYPEIAKRMRIEGVVRLEVSVDPAGKVTSVKTISGNRALSIAAEDAVRQWKFESAPNASTVVVTVGFDLNN